MSKSFGLPGSEKSGSGEFLGRIQYDARNAGWSVVRRMQGADGMWADMKKPPIPKVQLLMDFGTVEIGYSCLERPPRFLLVPLFQPFPERPDETKLVNGKEKPAFQPTLRVKVRSESVFGDEAAYYFTATSGTLFSALDGFLAGEVAEAAECQAGMIPEVMASQDEARAVIVKTPQGNNTFYSPVFHIVRWCDRPAVFGARTVWSPKAVGAGAAKQAPAGGMPFGHVPPPAGRNPSGGGALRDDEIPFAAAK